MPSVRNPLKRRLLRYAGACALLAQLAGLSGCAYYNTFYNIKKKFREAEKEQAARAQSTLTTPGVPGAPGSLPPPRGSSSGSSVGTDKYRKVIETGSKLLEFYPKSRWVDDTLLLMGISYYRTQDWARAERKFVEIITLYPKSKHVGQARLWKARALKEQRRTDEALRELEESMPLIDDEAERAACQALMGELLFSRQEWQQAAEQYASAIDKLPGSEQSLLANDLGICYYQLSDFSSAQKYFLRAAARLGDKASAFQSYILATRSATAMGEFESARKTLLTLRSSSRFADYVTEIDIELAQLAVNSGKVEDGVKLFQAILDREPDKAKRGKAFYRYGLVERDRRANLQAAKALLDSAVASGMSRELQDSARAETEQISKGLVAIQAIIALRDSIGELQQMKDSLQMTSGIDVKSPEAPFVEDAHVVADSSLMEQPSLSPDSLSQSNPETATSSPARAAADSLLKLLDAQDAERKSKAAGDSTVTPPAAPAPALANLSLQEIDSRLLLVRKQLQQAYLRAAEFYLLTLAENDSALTYYAQAASNPDDVGVFWKANLYLARELSKDSATAEQAMDFYRALVDIDSIPLSAQNEARAALGMEPVADPRDARVRLFAEAETARLSGEIPVEQVLSLYGRVVEYDSTTSEAYRALVAQFCLYDGRLGPFRIPDSVKAVAARLESMFPDSIFVREAKKVCAPDDSSSLYLSSDEELMALYMPKKTTAMFEEEPSESGWPPPEETLRGRRYN